MVVCIFCLKSNKIRDSKQLAGFLGCSLRVKIVDIPMKQGISVMNKDLFLPHDKFTNICCVFGMSLKGEIGSRFFLLSMSRRNLETILNSAE